MNRRAMLSLVAATALTPRTALAATGAGHGTKLLFVFLRGAYDATNVVAPVSNPFYREARPTLALPLPGSTDGARPLDGEWALHPALSSSIGAMFDRGQATFVPFAGVNDLTRSHFETQNALELGAGASSEASIRTGFLSRLMSELSGARPIAFTSQSPLIFRGDRPVANAELTTASARDSVNRRAAMLSAMYEKTPLRQAAADGLRTRGEVAALVKAEMEATAREAIAAKGFELEARRIARMMSDGYDLGFVDVGGWDTHVNQGAVSGVLATRIGAVGRGLAAFVEEIGERQWKSTVVVVVSEFGRTFRENGDGGTDHGHATTYWVLGGGVNGGRIVGEQIAISETTLHQNRDLPVLNEYRAVLGGIFKRAYGLRPASLLRVFPGSEPVDLGLT